MLPEDAAGVVSQLNWNNADGASGAVLDLVDSTAAATTVDVTWATDEAWSSGTPATSEAKIMGAWIASQKPDSPSTIVVSEIPYAVYDLYLYVGHDRAETDTVFNETGGAFPEFITVEDVTSVTLEADPFVYNAIVTSGDLGNYFKVSNLSQSSLNIAFQPLPGEDRAPITAMQLVQVPEPATALLIGVGAVLLGLGMRRR